MAHPLLWLKGIVMNMKRKFPTGLEMRVRQTVTNEDASMPIVARTLPNTQTFRMPSWSAATDEIIDMKNVKNTLIDPTIAATGTSDEVNWQCHRSHPSITLFLINSQVLRFRFGPSPPSSSCSLGRMIPNVLSRPNTVPFTQKEAKQTTQPQPPSGGTNSNSGLEPSLGVVALVEFGTENEKSKIHNIQQLSPVTVETSLLEVSSKWAQYRWSWQLTEAS